MSRNHCRERYRNGWDLRRLTLGYGLAVATWLFATAWLIRLSTITGNLHGVTLMTDRLPIAVAGGPPVPVVGFLGFGTVRIYVPVTAVATVLIGEWVSSSRAPGGSIYQIGLGFLAAVQLLALSGCGCGTGSVTALGEAAVAAALG